MSKPKLPSVVLENTGLVQTAVPFTFGQVFAVGDIKQGDLLPSGVLPDGQALPLQFDVKARHPDGSVRHAIISGVLPALAQGQAVTLQLAASPANAKAAPGVAVMPALMPYGFSTEVRLQLAGVKYTASPIAKMKAGGYRTWLRGAIVDEWHVDVPLTDEKGNAHPHLAARFAIRATAGRARVDVAIENGYTFVPAPQNFTYDVQVLVGDKITYSKAGLVHYHHARWRHIAWWGTAPQMHIRHDADYLIHTRAVPNYDRSIVVPEKVLASLQAKWTGAKTEPMGTGLGLSYMPTTGGRDDIGIMPSWAVLYLLSMDKRAKDVMLGTADQAGSWSVHFRNEQTGNPVSIIEYPYMTGLGRPNDTWNPVTKKAEAYPACAPGGNCALVHTADTSHQPAFSYLPYLVTGDYYYLEELQFYGLWNVAIENPNYREREKGLVHPQQVRGQAWSLRTLAEAAYITPDDHPLKSHFLSFVANNLAWYNKTYSDNPAANKLGALTNGYAYSYANRTAIAPWQDDFFTAVVGHMVELGFTDAAPLLSYKAKFVLARMVGEGAQWLDAAAYNLKLRDTLNSPEYTSIAQVYEASLPANVKAAKDDPAALAAVYKLKVGEMTGYSNSTVGYPSNMQPALAYAAMVGGEEGQKAWVRFMSRTVKPDYSAGPQFAIVPRVKEQPAPVVEEPPKVEPPKVEPPNARCRLEQAIQRYSSVPDAEMGNAMSNAVEALADVLAAERARVQGGAK